VRYRLSWVEYNAKDAEVALKHLDRLFEITRDRYALKSEAVQDYGLFAADLNKTNLEARGSIQGIFKHLNKVSEPAAALKAMDRMSHTFAKNGRRLEAIEVQEFLISENSFDVLAVDRALTIVEWTHTLADKQRLTEKYFWLISNFAPGSAWYVAQGTKLQIQRNATDRIEASVSFAINVK
jgi:hypothetical protein